MVISLRTIAWLLVTGCLLTFCGCGGGPDLPDTAPASGVVKHNGKPVANASVNFIPEQGKAANGVTDAEGKFTLTTFEPNDGAIVGKHKVTITPLSSEEIPEELPADYDYSAQGQDDTKSDLPALYGDPAQTTLSYEVLAGEKNNFEIELK